MFCVIDNNRKHFFPLGQSPNECSSPITTNSHKWPPLWWDTSLEIHARLRQPQRVDIWPPGRKFCSKPGGIFRRFPPNATGNPQEIKPSLNHRIQGTGINLSTFTNKINEMYLLTTMIPSYKALQSRPYSPGAPGKFPLGVTSRVA